MKIITRDDLIDIVVKAQQRGLKFLLSKFGFSKSIRTKSAFDQKIISHANWWIIPMVKARWNKLITGDKKTTYEEFLMTEILHQEKNLKMLCIGSGVSSHELKLAEYYQFEKIDCIDIANNRLKEAQELANKKRLKNIQFICADIYNYELKKNHYDIVFFHASLHHFKDMDGFFKRIINKTLKKNGRLIINEFVGANRHQFPNHQLKSINDSIKQIPKKYLQRFKSSLIKKRFYGSGVIRMIIADPSECVDSISIMPTIRKYFTIEIEKPYGGNLLANVLKDIAHHFVELDKEKENVLQTLFQEEDEYLKRYDSDFVFGVYRLK